MKVEPNINGVEIKLPKFNACCIYIKMFISGKFTGILQYIWTIKKKAVQIAH